MTRSAWGGAVVGAALAGVVVACASSQMTSASSPPPAPVMATAAPADPHAEIERLSRKLAGERTELGLPEPATSSSPAADCRPECAIEPMAVAPVAGDPACHRAKTDTCDDVCRLGDSICDDAGKICDLARQLATDAWAAGKCSDAQASCKAAQARCCSCS